MKVSKEQPKIIVVGSSSVDLVLNTEKYVKPNQTILANKSENFFGGKGANQAVGTARLGASVYFVGCVGMDPLGQQILRNLVEEGVNVGYVAETEDAPTGQAYVMASSGVNTIVVVPAANHCLMPKHIDEVEKHIAQTDVVLLQLEIPLPTVEHTIKLAKKYGKKVGLYAAPAQRLSEEILTKTDFILAKTDDIETIFGESQKEELLKRYPNQLFLRNDDFSTSFFDGEQLQNFPLEMSEVMHKMGIGDAFVSGFTVAVCHGNSVEDAVKFGNKISQKVAEKRGSQTNLPRLEEVL